MLRCISDAVFFSLKKCPEYRTQDEQMHVEFFWRRLVQIILSVSFLHIQVPPPPVPLHCPAVSRSHSIPSWAAAVFPGSLISMALQLRISVAWLPIHRGRGAWLAVTGSIPHPHQPLNKATQQDCFSSLMVGQPCNFCLIGLGVCDISTNSYRKLMYHQHVWNYPQLW